MSEKKTDFTKAVLLSLPPGSKYTSIEDTSELIVDPLLSGPMARTAWKQKRGYKKPTPWPSRK